MLKDLVCQPRYLGVIPQAGYIEYGFRIQLFRLPCFSGLPFFLHGFQGLLFDIFSGISGFCHHSPHFLISRYQTLGNLEFFTGCFGRRNKRRQFYPAESAFGSGPHPGAAAGWTFTIFRFQP